MIRRLTQLTLAALMVGTLAVSAADDLFEDRVIARGPDFKITESELDTAYLQRKAQLAAQGRQIPANLRPQVEKQTLDLLILKHTLLNMATEEEKTAAAATVEEQISQSPPELLGQQAKLIDLTEEEFKRELIDQHIAAEVVKREFQSKVEITEEMSRKFYDENPARFEAPERVTASHILFATVGPAGQPLPANTVATKKELAESVLARAKDGEDFTALVAEFSEDPGAASNQGEYTFGRGQMVPEFETAAWELKPGEISGLVKSQFGYHIIKKIGHMPAQMQDFSEADPNIRALLNTQELQKVLQTYTEELRKDPSIEIIDDRFKL